MLAPYLDAVQLQRVVAFAQQPDNADFRSRILRAILPAMVAMGWIEQVLRLAKEEDVNQHIQHLSFRSKALAAVAPYLSEEEIQKEVFYAQDRTATIRSLAEAGKFDQALTRTERLENPTGRCYAFAFIAIEMAKIGQVDRALTLIRAKVEIEQGKEKGRENNSTYAHILASALIKIAPHSPTTELYTALVSEVACIAQDISASSGTPDRTMILTDLAAHLHNIDLQHVYPIWTRLLEIEGALPRRELLKTLVNLIPTLKKYGGEQAVEEALLTARDVTRWWK